ncbi:hypothetical protein NDU88_006315 [Pleurodeles waltl]|uniref:Uncharacterized protein n=1 Tax=Pleurodeles waltl TaxID=8319 RepID=A0AAV7RM55_PLEWA|nr:hypothetical protein NDU88_006315 [Pleurodeles waltl]
MLRGQIRPRGLSLQPNRCRPNYFAKRRCAALSGQSLTARHYIGDEQSDSTPRGLPRSGHKLRGARAAGAITRTFQGLQSGGRLPRSARAVLQEQACSSLSVYPPRHLNAGERS